MKRIMLIIMTALTLLFTSCGVDKQADTPAAETAESTEAPAQTEAAETITELLEEAESIEPPGEGGVIVIDSRNPQSFNPLLNGDLSSDRLLRLIYEPLIALGNSEKPTPAIASSWVFSPDGGSLTLQIRTDALWADGTAITADDVIYSLSVIRNSPETALYNKCLENIIAYEKADDKTVKITYSRPFSGALYNLTFPVIPKHHFDRGPSDPAVTAPLGSGQYKMATYNKMRQIRLVASDNCYKGKPKISEIEVTIMRDNDAPLYAYEQNMIDIVQTSHSDWKKISTSRQSNIARYASQNYEFLALNFGNRYLSNLNVRKAIAHSLPQTEVVDKMYAGNAFETNTPVNPNSWIYDPETIVYNYDIEKAKKYISESGVDFSDNATLVILANKENAERVLTANRLQRELTKIGFNVIIDTQVFDEYVQKLYNKQFDIAVCGLEMSLRPNFSDLLSTNGVDNFSGYSDAAMDEYLALASTAVFEAAQISAYSSIQKKFTEDLPFISIAYRANVILTGKNVYGEANPVVNNGYNNIGELTIVH